MKNVKKGLLDRFVVVVSSTGEPTEESAGWFKHSSSVVNSSFSMSV